MVAVYDSNTRCHYKYWLILEVFNNYTAVLHLIHLITFILLRPSVQDSYSLDRKMLVVKFYSSLFTIIKAGNSRNRR